MLTYPNPDVARKQKVPGKFFEIGKWIVCLLPLPSFRVIFKIKTEEENIEKLKALSKLSPVFDVTSNGTNVDVQIERK